MDEEARPSATELVTGSNRSTRITARLVQDQISFDLPQVGVSDLARHPAVLIRAYGSRSKVPGCRQTQGLKYNKLSPCVWPVSAGAG